MWLAVIASAEDANDLDAETAKLRDALGAAFVVSPGSCFRELPASVRSGYVLGVIGGSRAQVVGLVTEVGEDASLVVPVVNVCGD
jgi:hypothetical protein